MFYNESVSDAILELLSSDFKTQNPSLEGDLQSITGGVLSALQWFWEFVHLKDGNRADLLVQFGDQRTALLQGLAKTDIVFAPCWLPDKPASGRLQQLGIFVFLAWGGL